MKLLSPSALATTAATAALIAAAALPGNAAGCPFAQFDTPQTAAAGDAWGGSGSASPDRHALGAALGGLATLAALLSGATVLVRQQQAAGVAAANAAALESEVDLGALAIETVLVVEPAEIESEVALAYRR